MRQLVCATLAVSVLSLGAAAAQAGETRTPRAVDAERFAVAANHQSPSRGHGYTARDRRITDCLATYPGYDPRIDKIRVRPGVTQRCML